MKRSSSGAGMMVEGLPPLAPAAVARNVSEASCRTDEEEASTTDTSPAATPSRPCLAAAGQEESEKGVGDDALSMFQQLYEAFFPKEGEDDESIGGKWQRQRMGVVAAGAADEGGSGAIKRARHSSVPQLSAGVDSDSDSDSGLAALPGECIREIASFLPASDLWPSFALISKRVSCRPAVVPMLMAACPRGHVPGALFGVWTAAGATEESSLSSGQVQQAAAPCRDVKALDLSRLPLGEAGAQRLASVLGDGHGLSSLRSLDLASSGLNGAASDALMCGAHTRSLQSLCLSNNGMGDRGVGGLAQALEEGAFAGLQALELANTGLTQQGVASLAQAFASGRCCSQLRRLDLSGNAGVGATGAALLMAGLRDGGLLHGLDELKLRGCSLGCAVAQALGEAFAAGSLGRLVLLDLQDDAMGPEGMAALAQGWSSSLSSSSSSSSLRHLYLGRNGMGDVGAQHLGAALPLLPCLETLSVPDNGVTAEGAAALWLGIEEGAAASRLSTLDVSYNPVGAEGSRGLARCLERRRCPGLASLNLSGTQLRADGMAHVAAALQATPAPALRRLLLQDNSVGDEGLVCLAAALRASACPALEELRLGGGDNSIGAGGASALAEAIEAGGLEALRVLDLAASDITAEGLRLLALACRAHARQLEVLDLSGRGDGAGGGVQPLGAYWLAAALGEGAFPRLQTLRLGGQGVGRSGLYMLHVAIRNGALWELAALDLDDSPEVGDAGAGYLAIALRRGGCPRLRALHLAGCRIGDKGLKHLAHAFAARPAHARGSLERLGLARNAGLTGEGLVHLGDALRAGMLPAFQHLELDGCRRVGDGGLCALAGALRGLSTLRAGGIGLTDEGLTAWVEAAAGTSLALRVLNLENNRLTSAGMAALSQLLTSNACRSLESLLLGKNGIDDAGAEALAMALATQRCPLLRELGVGENRVGEEGRQALATALLVEEAAPLCRLLLN